MLILNPDRVRFDDATWTDTLAISVECAAERGVIEWSDRGPHAAFADMPEVRTTLKVSRALTRDEVDGPRPGQRGELEFFTSPAAGDGLRNRVRAEVVVERVTYQFVAGKGAMQVINLIALSPDGIVDPLTIEPAA